jgi:SAM-dependent methyltransferase
MDLRTQERQTYDAMWGVPSYNERSPGERVVPIFMSMAEDARPDDTILDAGCGMGLGSLALAAAGFRPTMCDITDAGLRPEARQFPFAEACLWDDLRHLGAFDWVYCTDVMEHIPLPFTMLVASRLLTLARKGVFFNIALGQESYGFFIGKPGLHVSLQPFTAWRDQLDTVGRVRECRDLIVAGAYLVEPRR